MNIQESIDLGYVCLDRVGKFCYLGDMLIAGANSASLVRVHYAWGNFRELSEILTRNFGVNNKTYIIRALYTEENVKKIIKCVRFMSEPQPSMVTDVTTPSVHLLIR